MVLLVACDTSIVGKVNAHRQQAGRATLARSTPLTTGAKARAVDACRARSTAARVDPAGGYRGAGVQALVELVAAEPLTGTGTAAQRSDAARERIWARLKAKPVLREARWDLIGAGRHACSDGKLYLVVALGDREPAGTAPAVTDRTVGPVRAGAATLVTARIRGRGDRPVVLEHVTDFGAVESVPLGDGGVAGDAVAGDGVYSARLPARPAGTLVRYRIRLGSGDAAVHLPAPNGLARYDGHVVERPPVDTALAVLDWYLAPADVTWLEANRTSKAYRPAVLRVGGRVIDGVEVRNQGGATAQQSPKPNYKFKLPKGVTVTAPHFGRPVREFVADADHEDPTSALGVTAWQLFGRTGHPAREAATARLERNGTFFGVYQLYEELDSAWTDRLGPEPAVFEGEGGRDELRDWGSVEAMLAQWEQNAGDRADAEALFATMGRLGEHDLEVRRRAFFDELDVPEVVDLLAVSLVTQHTDSPATNLLVVRPSPGERWQVVTNDLDLTLGLRGRTRLPIVIPMPILPTTQVLYGDTELLSLVSARAATLYDDLLADPALLDGVRDRVAAMRADLALDRARWPLDLPSPEEGVADFEDYLAMWADHAADLRDTGVWPDADPATVRVSEIRAEGDGLDYVELATAGEHPVDVSGWRLGGAASASLPPGSVVPARSALVVPMDGQAVAALGLGTSVAGHLDAPLPTAGGGIELRDDGGRLVDEVRWQVSAGWPARTPDGRSLEAVALDDSRLGPAGWARAGTAPGTPGERGAALDPVTVDVWLPPTVTAGIDASAGRVVVRNQGDDPLAAVKVHGPGGACGEPVERLDAGGYAVRWCDLGEAARLRDFTASVGGAVVARTTRIAELDVVPPPGEATASVRLGQGALEVVGSVGPAGQACTGVLVAAIAEDEPERRYELVEAVEGEEVVHALAEPGTWRVGAACERDGFAYGWRVTPPITVRPSPAWPAAGDRALADLLHRRVLGRPATVGELDSWVAALGDGAGVGELTQVLLDGAGVTDPAAQWVRLNGTEAPEAWLAAVGLWLDGGGDRATVVESIRSADDFAGGRSATSTV